MSAKKIPNGSVPALAFADPSDLDEPWLSGFLSFKFDRHNHISLFYTTSISSPNFNGQQNFVLVYDADNLVPDETTLASHEGTCPSQWLEKIGRFGTPRFRTMSLKLRNACPVWYPRGEAPSSLPLYDTPGQQLVEIAKAIRVHLILDFSWLHKGYEACISRLTSNTKKLSGFPYGEILGQRFSEADWRIFQPVEAEAEPPAYAETSNKRSRRAISPASFSPPSKRAILAGLGYDPGSPTEVATPSDVARSCDTTIDESSPRSLLVEPSIEASPRPYFSDQQHIAISSVIAQHLPHAFDTFATQFFAHPSRSPSVSRTSERDSKSPPPIRVPKSAQAALIVSYMVPHLKLYCQNVLNRLGDYAYLRRECGDEEFREHLDEAKTDAQRDIDELKHETEADLGDVRDAMLREFKDALNNELAEYEDTLEGIYSNVEAEAKDTAAEMKAAVVCEAEADVKEMIAAEVKEMIAAEVKEMIAAEMKETIAVEVKKMIALETLKMKTGMRQEAVPQPKALSLDAADKARNNHIPACHQRSFRRGKGGYRGLGHRCCSVECKN